MNKRNLIFSLIAIVLVILAWIRALQGGSLDIAWFLLGSSVVAAILAAWR